MALICWMFLEDHEGHLRGGGGAVITKVRVSTAETYGTCSHNQIFLASWATLVGTVKVHTVLMLKCLPVVYITKF